MCDGFQLLVALQVEVLYLQNLNFSGLQLLETLKLCTTFLTFFPFFVSVTDLKIFPKMFFFF